MTNRDTGPDAYICLRAGDEERARRIIAEAATNRLYMVRRDLVRLVEFITDETERRHEEGDPGPDPNPTPE